MYIIFAFSFKNSSRPSCFAEKWLHPKVEVLQDASEEHYWSKTVEIGTESENETEID